MNKYIQLIENCKKNHVMKSDLIAQNNSIYEEIKDLPCLYIIGDSISITYTPFVRNNLLNKINVLRVPYNTKSSRTILHDIENIMNIDRVDYCFLNCGIHDIMFDRFVSLEEYDSNLRKIIKYITKFSKLIWVETTPFFNPITLKNINYEVHDTYRNFSLNIMNTLNIPVCKIGDYVEKNFIRDEDVQNDGVHFSPKGDEKLGLFLSDYITKNIIKKRKVMI